MSLGHPTWGFTFLRVDEVGSPVSEFSLLGFTSVSTHIYARPVHTGLCRAPRLFLRRPGRALQVRGRREGSAGRGLASASDPLGPQGRAGLRGREAVPVAEDGEVSSGDPRGAGPCPWSELWAKGGSSGSGGGRGSPTPRRGGGPLPLVR